MDPGEAEPGYGSEAPDDFSESDLGLVPELALQGMVGAKAPS
jgi:hypothetical protein